MHEVLFPLSNSPLWSNWPGRTTDEYPKICLDTEPAVTQTPLVELDDVTIRRTGRHAADSGLTIFRPLPREFFWPDAREVAPLLLGHWLVRSTPEGAVGGLIVETEAYLHNDPACHGYRGLTPRNKAMFGPPGMAYVYFIYGNHWCFNAVCQPEGIAEAVLIRAIEPRFGQLLMQRRRPGHNAVALTNGPAKFCQALGIDRACDGVDLTSRDSSVFLAENPLRALSVRELGPVTRTTRIGITQAADWPLRFYFERSQWVSRRVRNLTPPA